MFETSLSHKPKAVYISYILEELLSKTYLITSASKSVGKREYLAVVENVGWYSDYGNTVQGFLGKLKIELPYNPAAYFLDLYSEGMGSPSINLFAVVFFLNRN